MLHSYLDDVPAWEGIYVQICQQLDITELIKSWMEAFQTQAERLQEERSQEKQGCEQERCSEEQTGRDDKIMDGGIQNKER